MATSIWCLQTLALCGLSLTTHHSRALYIAQTKLRTKEQAIPYTTKIKYPKRIYYKKKIGEQSDVVSAARIIFPHLIFLYVIQVTLDSNRLFRMAVLVKSRIFGI